MRQVLLAGLLVLTGCSTLATLHGARTLEPHDVVVGVAVSAQRASNPLGAALPFFPQVEMAMRYGIADDVDFGLRAYLLGAGGDVRYRFFRGERLDLATAPGLDLFYLPTVGGSAELRTPVLGEYPLGPVVSIGAGPALLMREQWNRVKVEGEKGTSGRLDLFAGAGARLEVHPSPIVFGVSVDFYAQPARAAGLAWSAGLDLSLLSRKPKDPVDEEEDGEGPDRE